MILPLAQREADAVEFRQRRVENFERGRFIVLLRRRQYRQDDEQEKNRQSWPAHGKNFAM